MPILFSAVAHDRKIIAKYASCDGNFVEIAEEVLQKIPSKNDKMTYSHGHYLLHYIVENEYSYFCITTKTCQRSRSFLFLNEINRRFTSKQEGFSQVLADEMYRYSEDYNTIVIRKGELDELNNIGVGCSETLLGEKILFVSNTDNLRYSIISHVGGIPETSFLDTTKDKNNSNYFYYIILTVILLLIWLFLSSLGPISLVAVACICVFSITKFTRDKAN